MFAIRAGELGVPVGMVSGDQVVAAEVQSICPWAETAILEARLRKTVGNGNSARTRQTDDQSGGRQSRAACFRQRPSNIQQRSGPL